MMVVDQLWLFGNQRNALPRCAEPVHYQPRQEWPVTRLAHFTNTADIDTVIVNGKVLMRGRQIPHLDITQILDEAARQNLR